MIGIPDGSWYSKYALATNSPLGETSDLKAQAVAVREGVSLWVGAIVAEGLGGGRRVEVDRMFTVDGSVGLGEQDAGVIIRNNDTKRILCKTIS